jgi:hypothetical protein
VQGRTDPIIRRLGAVGVSPTPAWVFAVTLVPSAFLVLLLALQPWMPLHQLVRDPMAVVEECLRPAETLEEAQGCARVPFGVLSNLGILLWCAAAATSLFAFLLVHRASGRIRPGAFLLYAGIFTACLLMDDFFQGHEKVVPRILGLHERVVFVAYALALVAYLVVFRQDLAKSEPALLLIGIGLFAVSILTDQAVEVTRLFQPDGVIHRATEDGSKFVAISAWAMFHVRAAWLTVQRVVVGAA